MTELRDLHSTLDTLRQAGKTAKVSFYYINEGDSKLQTGSIAVEHGADCYINFQQLPPEVALEQIARLHFAKVTSLPSMDSDHSGDSWWALPMTDVLDRLDPAKFQPPAPAEVVQQAAPVAAAAAPKQPHVFYSHVSMQNDALNLLEPLFGLGAHKKVEEFARASPPHQHPQEFLGKCRQHAAMMLGAKKAEELFRPIFDKLAH